VPLIELGQPSKISCEFRAAGAHWPEGGADDPERNERRIPWTLRNES